MSCESLFREQLKLKGLRLTEQRKIVLDVLHNRETSMPVDELYAEVLEQDETMDLSTVYRTLDLLKEIGLVQEIQGSGRQKVYHLSSMGKPHVHLVCQQCGMIFSADLSLFLDLKDKIGEELGFDSDMTQVTIPGICQDCKSFGK